MTLENDIANRQVVDYSLLSKLDLDLNENLKQFDIFGQPWKYYAEGNSNIVIALPAEDRVLRIPKQDVGHADENLSRPKKKLLREVIFANQIFGPLLGPELVGAVDIVYIGKEQISKLNNSIRNIRPKHRLHRELSIPYATSRTDFTRIHSASSENTDFCVEIKLKQGYWNNKLYGEPSTICNFCLNQYLKLKQNKIKVRTCYCPLDLFSGEPRRMILALKNLILNPQNNIRVFKDGELIFGESMDPEYFASVLEDWILRSNSSKIHLTNCVNDLLCSNSLQNFLYLICLALLKPQRRNDREEDSAGYLKAEMQYELLKLQLWKILTISDHPHDESQSEICKNCRADSKGLPEGSLLSRVLSAQKLGDFGVENIMSMYSKICPTHNTSTSTSLPKSETKNCPSSECSIEEMWLDELPNLALTEQESLNLENYLLSKTMNDCSVMLTFSPIIPKVGIVIETEAENMTMTILQDLLGNFHRVVVGIADLDPKPVTVIPRRYCRDAEMLQAYKIVNSGA